MTAEILGREIVIVDRRGRRICRPLLSGFVCPKCGEVLKAYFKTDEPVDIGQQESRTYGQEQFRSLIVTGGQALISETHREYGGLCDLKIYWAPSLRHNLSAWLRKHQPDRSCDTYDVGLTQVMAQRVPGLVPIPDVIGGDVCLLGFDDQAWCPAWDHRSESYEEWNERVEETKNEKLTQLGVVSET